MKLNSKIEALLDFHSDSVALPSEAAKKCVQHAFVMTQLQSEISGYFADDEDCDEVLFNLTGKNHMVLHSVMLSSFLHPWMVWCFMGEDFMRKVQKIGESCVRGLQATAVSKKMLSHYRLGMHKQLCNHN